MDITLFTTENCSSCKRVETQLKKLLNGRNGFVLHIENIKNIRSKGVIIAPAVFIDEELYSYGDLNEERFLETLNFISSGN